MSERFCTCTPTSLVPCVECAADGHTTPATDYNEREARRGRKVAATLKSDAELERGVYAFTEDHPDAVDPPCHCGVDECLAPGVYICTLHGKAAEREQEEAEASLAEDARNLEYWLLWEDWE